MKIPASLVKAYDLKDTSDLKVNDDLTITVCQHSGFNPLWSTRARDFITKNPDHPACIDAGKFTATLGKDWNKEQIDFIADVLVVSWESKELGKYTPGNARDLLNALPRLAASVLTHGNNQATYENSEVEAATGN